MESGERYVGEWEEGKPKWVQSLGEDGDEPNLSDDMQEKVTRALEVRLGPTSFQPVCVVRHADPCHLFPPTVAPLSRANVCLLATVVS